jgi:hypothetical protein
MTTFHPMPRGVALLAAGLLAGCGEGAFDNDQGSSESAQEEQMETRLRAEIHGPTDIRFTLAGAERPVRVPGDP